MKMTKEERDELNVMARMAKVSGFKLVNCDVDVMLSTLDTIDALEAENKTIRNEDLEDLEKKFDELKAERNLYHATLTECLKIAGWASSGDGDTAWACEDIEVNIEEAFNKSADKETK